MTQAHQERIYKGDRVRVIADEPGGFGTGTLATVFWVGMGQAGHRRGMRCGLRRDDQVKAFMGVERVQKVDPDTGASAATHDIATAVYRIIARHVDTVQQHALRDGSVTVTGRVQVISEAQADRLDQLPADIHNIWPGALYRCDIDEQTGERVYQWNCLASREEAP